jgi:hypothetical protein
MTTARPHLLPLFYHSPFQPRRGPSLSDGRSYQTGKKNASAIREDHLFTIIAGNPCLKRQRDEFSLQVRCANTGQKLGRWKSISMVERYVHHCPESLRPGVETLDRIITIA